MSNRRIGIYPGTFDPITNGHLDIIVRASRIVDHLVVGVAINAGKGPMFTLDERLLMVREEIGALNGRNGCTIEARTFSGLLVHYATQQGASIIFRGLRAVSDFDYEFQMTGMNSRLDPRVETVFLMSAERVQFISSRLVKEICVLGGDVSSFVTENVARHLVDRVRSQRGGSGA